jgi:hypothetical protein
VETYHCQDFAIALNRRTSTSLRLKPRKKNKEEETDEIVAADGPEDKNLGASVRSMER